MSEQCGSRDPISNIRCYGLLGHDGKHSDGGEITWTRLAGMEAPTGRSEPPQCDSHESDGRVRCTLLRGHDGNHFANHVDGVALTWVCVGGDASAPAGRKNDDAKLPYDVLPWGAVESIVKVLEHGRREYAADNWRDVPEPRRRYFAAMLRHLVAWRRGESIDPDSGLPHLAHACCCGLFLLEFEVGLGPTSAEMDAGAVAEITIDRPWPDIEPHESDNGA